MGSAKLHARFPQTNELIRNVTGLDPAKDLIPIKPVAHRPIGGIEANISGQTPLHGLFAAGECACTGLNGAGRLAGNVLTEAVLFGARAGEAAALTPSRRRPRVSPRIGSTTRGNGSRRWCRPKSPTIRRAGFTRNWAGS